MPRGVDTGTDPTRRVGRERYAPKQTRASRGGDSYSMAGGPARSAFTMSVDRTGGITNLATGGRAGRITRRGPRFAGRD